MVCIDFDGVFCGVLTVHSIMVFVQCFCLLQRVDERSACCSALQGRITLMICAIINWLSYVCFLCVTACILCISTVFPPAAFTSAMCPENVTLFIF